MALQQEWDDHLRVDHPHQWERERRKGQGAWLQGRKDSKVDERNSDFSPRVEPSPFSPMPGYRRKVPLLLFSVSNEAMKRLPLFALLIGMCTIAVGQDELRIAYRDGLYGYIDPSGSWVIEPRFIEASGWEDGAASVMLPNGDYAFIDRNGKYLMRPRRLQRLGDLSEGLAVFEPEGAKYDTDGFVKNVGFMDVTGRVVITPHFFAAYDFSEGVAAASVEFNKCGYIDKQGNFVIEPVFEFPSYQACGRFSEGLTHVVKRREIRLHRPHRFLCHTADL